MLSVQYAAGFFDGEGCVYAGLRLKKNPFVLVCISNTDFEVLSLFRERWGGTLHERRKKAGWRSQWQWALGSNKARVFLAEIAPFVIVKRQHVAVALSFLAEKARPQKERRDYSIVVKRGGRYWAVPLARPEYLERLRQLYFELRRLNGRGANARRGPEREPVWQTTDWAGHRHKTLDEQIVPREELEALKAQVQDLFGKGLTRKAIAEQLQLPYTRVSAYVKGIAA